MRAKPSNYSLARKPGLRGDNNNRQMFSDSEHSLADEQTGIGLGCAGKQR